jgi:hypothetical protein
VPGANVTTANFPEIAPLEEIVPSALMVTGPRPKVIGPR